MEIENDTENERTTVEVYDDTGDLENQEFKKENIVKFIENINGNEYNIENENNNDPENLIPLCPTHHQYLHSRYRNLIIDKINEYINGRWVKG